MMLPLVILGRRPALAGFGLCVGLLVLATLPLEGWYSWWWFFSGARHSSINLVTAPFQQVFPVAGETTFYMARSFGAGVRQAWMVQGVSSLLAAGVTWQVWRMERCDPVFRMAITVCLTVLVVPYGYLYDLVGYCVAMAAVFFRAPDGRKPVYVVLWLFAGYSGAFAGLTGHIFMPAAAALGAFMVWLEMRADARREESPVPPHVHSPASVA